MLSYQFGTYSTCSRCCQCRPICCPITPIPDPIDPPCCTRRCNTIGPDYGPDPYVFDIHTATLTNPYFRHAIWTGTHLQITLMCIAPGGEIGLEMHDNLDQFLRLEQGEGLMMMGATETSLTYRRRVTEDSAIVIPAGTWHNLVNTGTTPIKLYSIYAPPQHPAGTIHCTKADSDDAE